MEQLFLLLDSASTFGGAEMAIQLLMSSPPFDRIYYKICSQI
ncbi:hypothetical protein [Paenibacillus sp. OSY-SE]|nr:hypothetical protein [Paenibacillus sp. OSY-SE]